MSLKFTTPESGLNTMTRCVQNMKSGGSGCKLTDVSVEYTENGEYEVEIPDGFDGFSSVDVKVDVATEGLEYDFSKIGYNSQEDSEGDETIKSTLALELSEELYNSFDPLNDNYGYHPFSETDIMFAPKVDLSHRTKLYDFYYNCKNLVYVPMLDTSNVESYGVSSNKGGWFRFCSSLKTIPLLDTGKLTNMTTMFDGCTSLVTIPPLNTSNVTSMTDMFSGCSSLTTVPFLDTSKVRGMSSMFSGCTALRTVSGIDFSGLTSDLKNLFGYTGTITTTTHFIVNGKINVSISDIYSLKALKSIDYDSVKSILVAASKTDNTNAKTLALSRTMSDPDGELNALVEDCATKGWTITGLTLN